MISLVPWMAAVADLNALGLRYSSHDAMSGAPTIAPPLWCIVRIDGALRTGFPVLAQRSRAVPGCWLLRVDRIGGDAIDRMAEYATEVFRVMRKARPLVLRVNIAMYEARVDVRRAMTASLVAAGYEPTVPRQYVETLLAKVLPTDDAQIASFSSGTRRNIREADRNGVVVRPVDYGAYRETIDRLLLDSFTRHGVSPLRVSPAQLMSGWAEQMVLLGAFLPEGTTGEKLVGFAKIEKVGDLGVYAAAGTLRRPELGRMPISYPLLREGFRWARQVGCSTFDLGGVPPLGDEGDPRASIAAFKAGFGGSRIAIGGEWQCSPNLALRSIDRAVQALRRFR